MKQWHEAVGLLFHKGKARPQPSPITQAEFRALFANVSEGVVIYDPNFTITAINQRAEALFGVRAEEVVGLCIEPSLVKNPKLKILAQVLYPSLAPTIAQISEGGWPQITDITFEDPPLALRTTLSQITNEKGEVVEFLKLADDLTREKSLLKSKSEFLTTSAHQLRTPLTGIHWAFESLMKAAVSQELKTTIEEGYALSARALKIINDLLDAAKIEEGRFGYALQNVNVVGLIQDVVAQAKVIAEAYNVTVRFEPQGETYVVQADPARLGIAVANIIDNAIRYNVKGGTVTVRIETVPGKPFLRVVVEDTGVGIPEGELNKMFTKFYRGSNVAELEPNGSGLGLYITRNIIKHHGGEAGIESRLGRGSTFWFTLPTNPELTPERETAYDPETQM